MAIIVEVGAHTGTETFNFLMDSSAQVYTFEPDPVLFRELQNTSRHHPRLTVLPFAIDIGDNQEPLFHFGDGKSTLDIPMFGSSSAKFTLVWTMRLDTFMSLYSIDKIDYLRIDAPYREEMCLESLGDRVEDVVRGRVRRYTDDGAAMAFLHGHNFSVELDTTSANILEPDIRFWRTL